MADLNIKNLVFLMDKDNHKCINIIPLNMF